MLECSTRAFDFDNVLIQPAASSSINSRKLVNLTGDSMGGVPIIAANMVNIGNFSMAEALQKHSIYTAIQKTFSYSDWVESEEKYNLNYNLLVPTIGADTESIEKFWTIFSDFGNAFEFVCFDVANGHTEDNMLIAKEIKDRLPDNIKMIYGNLANPHAIQRMADLDFKPEFVKIGIGSGSVCTTRLKTGIGVPQATLVDQFKEYTTLNLAHGWKPKIISDGGCRTPADLVKAYVLGADMVMLGGMLAFHNEGLEEGRGRCDDGPMYHFGNSSEKANGYDPSKDYRTVEGKVVSGSCRGPVDNTIKDILGGIRSACTYLNCNSINDLKDRRSQVMTVQRVVDNY